MNWLNPAALGFAVRRELAELGASARLFLRLVALAGRSFARPRLVSEQVHLLGNLSLAIGPHEIVFRHPELGEQRHAATVTLNSQARLSVDLRKK